MKTYQPFLFAEFQSKESSDLTNGMKFQVLSYNDPSNKFTVTVENDEDAEKVALQKLGYFVVPEVV